MSPRILVALSSISGGRCWYCGGTGPGCISAPVDMVVDHVKPRCRGGKDTLDNGALACWGCNSLKAGHTLEWMRKRLGGLVCDAEGWFEARDAMGRLPVHQWPRGGRLAASTGDGDGPAYLDDDED